MLSFLETGKALYVLMAVCFLGIFSRIVTRNLYKRLIKESNNITVTKNRYLRDLKQRAENTYRVNQGILNTRAYLERQLYEYHFAGIHLNGWCNISNQLVMLCFLAGGTAAFLSYWYRLDQSYIVLYGTVGVLSGLLNIMIDNGMNLTEKHNQLLTMLQDYLENSLYQRMTLDNRNQTAVHSEHTRTEAEESGKREKVFARRSSLSEQRAVKEGNTRNVIGIGGRETTIGHEVVGTRDISEARDKSGIRETMDQRDMEPMPVRRDVDYLKRSLEQIAASREKNKVEADWIKNLTPEELQLIGDIMKEYLA